MKNSLDSGMVQWEEKEVLFHNRAKYKKLPDNLRTLQEQLAEKLSTKVSIKKNTDGSGRLIIEYYSEDDLKRVFDALNGNFY